MTAAITVLPVGVDGENGLITAKWHYLDIKIIEELVELLPRDRPQPSQYHDRCLEVGRRANYSAGRCGYRRYETGGLRLTQK